VRVTTSEASQVEFRVKYEVSPWILGFGGERHVDSRQNGNVVELDASTGWHVGFSIGGEHMSIEVRMPRNADLQIESVDGQVDIAQLTGRVVVRSVDGGIDVSQLTGTIDLKSNDGVIRANTLKGDLKLQSVDGSISGTDLDGRCVVHTNDGAVGVTGRFDALDVRSNDGMLTARVESGSTITSTWRIRSNDGSVRVSLPSDFKASLDATTSDGHINVHLPVEVHGTVSKSELHGTLNGGGPSMVLQTVDGVIELNRE
jgi:DUF4097 and DUF4098 domain-containing protein YvlB